MLKNIIPEINIEYETCIHNLFVEIKKLDNVAMVIDKVLNAALDYYQADRAYIFESSSKFCLGENTYEVCAPNVVSQIETLHGLTEEENTRWGHELNNGEGVVIKNIKELQEKYPEGYKFLKEQDIQNLMIIPFNKLSVIGYIGVDNPKEHNDDITFLHDVSYLILSSLTEKYLKNDILHLKDISIKTGDVYIKTFGSFKIETSFGVFKEEDISSRLGFLFFVYLLLKKPDLPTTNELAKVLWPNQDSLDSYDYLRNLAFRTRKMLRSSIGEELVIAKEGSYAFSNKLNIITDYELLDKLYLETMNSPKEQNIENYEKIIKLYDGNIFPKLEAETWLIPVVEKYRSIFIEVTDKYLQVLHANKEYYTMLETCKKALKVDSSIGLFHYFSILAYIGKDQIEVAKSYFYKIKSILNEENLLQLNILLGIND